MRAKGYSPSQAIKDAAKHGELVVFVGAGASMLCGSPDWRGFANKVVDAVEHAGHLSFLEAEQLRGLGDPRRTLSIAIELARDMGTPIDFDAILHPGAPDAVGRELYRLLAALRPVFVTTNYDKWLDSTTTGDSSLTELPHGEADSSHGPKPRDVYHRSEQLTSDMLLERGAVIHLHGSVNDPASMVVSLRDYINHYGNERIQTFLREMFRNYTVLFVGYGLNELEVLEYIIRADETADAKAEPRHFLLYPYRTSEEAQTNFIERFFRRQCGIEVIRYCIDKSGWRELVDVFREWQPQLDIRDANVLEVQRRLDTCIAQGERPSQREAALRLLQRNPELTAYFLNSLKDPIWFSELQIGGFFDPRANPPAITVRDGRGERDQVAGWPALRYVEHIAPSAEGALAEQIANIVRSVSNDAAARGINNWRTSWSLATILSYLPTSIIKVSDIELARTWLAGVGQELGERLLPRLLRGNDGADAEKALALVDVLTALRPAGADQ